MVDEPNTDDTLLILTGLKEAYEVHHRCTYSDGALAAAVHLSNRYIADRQLPDKAIDLIDEAGSRARINSFLSRKSMEDSSSEEWDAMLSQAEELKQVWPLQIVCAGGQLCLKP